MKNLFISATTYLVLGLAAGVFYREFSKANNFPSGEYTQLSVLHTHLLSLGFLVMLVALLVDKAFDISSDSRFKPFFWIYNAGLVVTSSIMTIRGSLTVVGVSEELPALAGIAGIGHILLALGLGLFMVSLGSAIWKK